MLARGAAKLDNDIANVSRKSRITYQIDIEGGFLCQAVIVAYSDKWPTLTRIDGDVSQSSPIGKDQPSRPRSHSTNISRGFAQVWSDAGSLVTHSLPTIIHNQFHLWSARRIGRRFFAALADTGDRVLHIIDS